MPPLLWPKRAESDHKGGWSSSASLLLEGWADRQTESVDTVAATNQSDIPRPMKRDKDVLAIAHEAGWTKYRTKTRRTMASPINTVKLRRLLPDNTMWPGDRVTVGIFLDGRKFIVEDNFNVNR